MKKDVKSKKKKDDYYHEVKFIHNLHMKQGFTCLANVDS